MKKIFIGGSRHVSRLNAEVRKRIDKITSQKFWVLVGDANGADKAVQLYLHSKNYPNVEVFCSEGICRNNVGNWTIRAVLADTRERNADFYSAKDRVMAQEAEYGLMLWDGKSIGTLMNLARLIDLHKKSVVYIVPDKSFTELHDDDDWRSFMSRRDTTVRDKLRKRASLERSKLSEQPSLLDRA
jgi:hypothetical protein